MIINILISLFLLFLYVVPSIIALSRNHKSKLGITLINILLGWTIIGWFATLFWAIFGSRKAE